MRELLEKELLIKSLLHPPKLIPFKEYIPDLQRDLVKIVFIQRTRNASPVLGFVKNFGLKKGAIGTSLTHDSCSILAIGVSDREICNGINGIIEEKGGMGISYENQLEILPLPVGGLMSHLEGEEVARRYSNLEEIAKGFGTFPPFPFRTLSFLSSLFLPELRLSAKGLFDTNTRSIIPLFESSV